MLLGSPCSLFFFFNDTATTEIYTLSLHDALPICFAATSAAARVEFTSPYTSTRSGRSSVRDRKSTRLNSSHLVISYAVFCLKKKNTEKRRTNGVTPVPAERSTVPWSRALYLHAQG